MITFLDFEAYPPIEWLQFRWFLEQGVQIRILIDLMPIRVACGVLGRDGRFDDDSDGERFIVFAEGEDAVFWQPRTGEIASLNCRAFALGEDAICDPATYAFDGYLNLLPDPLAWLRSGRDGIVVLDWSRAWSRLQDAPRIAVHESLLFQYRRFMKPPRGPDTFVLTDTRWATASLLALSI